MSGRGGALRTAVAAGLRSLERMQRDPLRAAARALDAVARSREPAMRRAFADAVRELRAAIRQPEVTALLEAGRAAEAVELVPWERVAPDLRAAWERVLVELAAGAGRVAAQMLPEPVTVDLAERHAEAAAAAARARAADLVTAIGEDQRAAVRATVERVFGPSPAGAPQLIPAQAARLIADTVGLAPRQAAAALKLRDALEADGVPAPKVQRAVADYATRAARQRGDMIARTETLAAVGQGQQVTWEGAATEGLLDEAAMSRVWLVTDDDRLDLVVCAPMEEQRRGLRELFETGDGRRILTIPAHPGCRCSVVLEVV